MKPAALVLVPFNNTAIGYAGIRTLTKCIKCKTFRSNCTLYLILNDTLSRTIDKKKNDYAFSDEAETC